MDFIQAETPSKVFTRLVRIDGGGSYLGVDGWRYRPPERRTKFRPGDEVQVEVPIFEDGTDAHADEILVGKEQEHWFWTDRRTSTRGV